MIFLKKKIHGNMIFSANAPKRWSIQKNIALENDLSCIIWKDGIFLRKILYFSFGRKMKDDITLFQKKKSKMIFSRKKKILKVIDIQDRILERVPTIFCTFMETFTDVFIYCFLVKKTPGNLIYRIEI